MKLGSFGFRLFLFLSFVSAKKLKFDLDLPKERKEFETHFEVKSGDSAWFWKCLNEEKNCIFSKNSMTMRMTKDVIPGTRSYSCSNVYSKVKFPPGYLGIETLIGKESFSSSAGKEFYSFFECVYFYNSETGERVGETAIRFFIDDNLNYNGLLCYHSDPGFARIVKEKFPKDITKNFVELGFLWDEKSIKFYIDGKKVGDYSPNGGNPFNEAKCNVQFLMGPKPQLGSSELTHIANVTDWNIRNVRFYEGAEEYPIRVSVSLAVIGGSVAFVTTALFLLACCIIICVFANVKCNFLFRSSYQK